MRSDRSKWLVVVALAVALGWLSTRGTSGPSFMRLPVGPMPAPAWTMPDLDGRAVASTNFAGKVVLLPHMGSATIEGRIDMGEKVIINIKTFADGHKPPDRVIPAML